MRVRVRSITPDMPQLLDCVTVSGLQFVVSELDVIGWDEECDPEPPAAERVSQLVVTYMDGSTSKHDAPEGTMLDSRGYLRVVGGPTINVANVRFWQLEKP